jgi:hypothetical protein
MFNKSNGKKVADKIRQRCVSFPPPYADMEPEGWGEEVWCYAMDYALDAAMLTTSEYSDLMAYVMDHVTEDVDPEALTSSLFCGGFTYALAGLFVKHYER